MKILIDLTSLYHNLSGIERYAICMTSAMLKHCKMNTYILLFKNEVCKAFKNIINEKSNVSAVVIQGNNKIIFNQFILPFHLYKYKADAFLFFAFQNPLLFRGRNIYTTIHDLVCWDYPDTMRFLQRLYFKISIINATKNNTGLIANSDFTAKRIIEKFNYDKDKLIRVYCGVSDLFTKFSYSSEKGITIKEKYCLPDNYILCLSTIEPRKNLKLLIDAFNELVIENKITCNLVLAGREGWKTDNIFKIPEHLKNRIFFTGFIEDEDLPYIYKQADCFVFPSIYEGFGIPILEAMSVGLPVISSDAASLPEVAGDAGLLFKSNDKNSLKNKIVYFYNLNDLDRMNLVNTGYDRCKYFDCVAEEVNKLNKIIGETI